MDVCEDWSLEMNGTSALFTDFYELTMAQGYWKRDLHTRAIFDYFFRRNPFSGGYSVFAGLDPLVDVLQNFSFSSEDIEFLASQRIFEQGFLDYLSCFRFTGNVHGASEGQLVFPQEPVIRVEADIIEAQIVEGVILNHLNFQSLIATKSARIWRASGYGSIMEFGLRRAQGFDGAMSATRAACIGGASATSNTLAGKVYGIPVMGTMAHSWVMSFPDEASAFDSYASIYPDATVFLIDTYDTMGSGIIHAIESGKKLAAAGKRFGVRLDSGDIDYLTLAVRTKLDEAGLTSSFIVVSNELDEEIIEHLVTSKAPVDSWGVGTHLVTGGKEASFTGVYKLAAILRDGCWEPTMKVSDNPDKATNPGIKDTFRLYDSRGLAIADLITVAGEEPVSGQEILLNHPSGDWRHTRTVPSRVEKLLVPVMEQGKRLTAPRSIHQIRAGLRASMDKIDGTYLRLLNPHVYKVSISTSLKDMKLAFFARRFGAEKAGS